MDAAGKQIFIVSQPVLEILKSDSSAKLKLVNTGTRLLERSDLRGVRFPFRLTQVGGIAVTRRVH